MKNNKKTLLIGLSLPVQMILVRIVAVFPDQVERYYSNGLYPIISKGLRVTFGWLPFSFGDLMYGVLIILILRSIFLFMKAKGRFWKLYLSHALAIVAVVYFTFHLFWGLNYYRLPLHAALEIENDYTTENLVVLTQQLIEKSNALHDALAVNDTTAVVVVTKGSDAGYYAPAGRTGGFVKADLFQSTLNGYQNLKQQFPKLDYPPKSIKTSLLSYPLSIMGYSGYLNPITNEAQVNGLVPAHRWPVISCHEQAHQLGFAKENEANFIAVLATINNDDPYFKYSGSIFALRYCLNDLYRRDQEIAERLKKQIRPGILKNYEQSRTFWDAMENPLEPVFKYFYSGFLKANNQPEGIKTYSYMVALLVNYNLEFPKAF